ncbi:MAG: cytochrome c biogenesis CcdA family protein [Acidimicrobiia bacterium]
MTGVLAVAFAAGMVATVNPCGFAMLPAYLGFFIGDKDGNRRPPLLVGLSMSVGMVIVFLVVGLLVASGIRVVVVWIPWLAAVVGVGLIVVGVAKLRGRNLLPHIPLVARAPRGRSFLGLVGFGASYSVASLSCTLPIFLSLIAGAVAGRSYLQSLSVFFAYGAGMSLVVVALTLALGVGRDRVLHAVRPVAARLGTISGWILIGAGAFIVWYWATVLASGGVGLADNLVIRLIEGWTAGAAGLVSAQPLLSSVLLAAIALIAWWSIRRVGAGGESEESGPASDRPGDRGREHTHPVRLDTSYRRSRQQEEDIAWHE